MTRSLNVFTTIDPILKCGFVTRECPTVNSTPTPKNKKVTFCEKLLYWETISRHDISPSECKAAWYSKQEFEEISRACCKEIQRLDHGKLLKDRKYCARGLESNTRLASITRDRNRALVYQIVFDEQDRQRREGVREAEYLSCLYHSVSSSCQLWANVVGLADQRASEEIMESESEEYTSRHRSIVAASNTSPPSPLRIRKIELARAA